MAGPSIHTVAKRVIACPILLKSEEGFNIPLVRSLFVSRYSDWLFAGTPGGLYISKDGGETWQDGNLWLQFDKNTRRELGGASFIDAYCRRLFSVIFSISSISS